jgi:hypothetical protein
MREKSEKFLSLDQFKEKVYKNIGTLETLDEGGMKEILDAERRGCFGLFVIPLIRPVISKARRRARQEFKIEELNRKADAILTDREIKKSLCEKLDATIVLPIDAAYKLTPVLYALALENEEKVPFDSMLFAVICRRIVKQGVEKFCEKEKKD